MSGERTIVSSMMADLKKWKPAIFANCRIPTTKKGYDKFVLKHAHELNGYVSDNGDAGFVDVKCLACDEEYGLACSLHNMFESCTCVLVCDECDDPRLDRA